MDRKVSRGMTIFEVLVVIAIIAILAGTAIVYFTRQVNQARLREGVNMVVGALEEARRMSSSRKQLFGVRINERTIEVVQIKQGCDVNTGQAIQTYTMPAGVRVNQQKVVVYDRMGYPRNANCGIEAESITITSTPLEISRTVCINRYGRIRIVEGETCSQE